MFLVPFLLVGRLSWLRFAAAVLVTVALALEVLVLVVLRRRLWVTGSREREGEGGSIIPLATCRCHLLQSLFPFFFVSYFWALSLGERVCSLHCRHQRWLPGVRVDFVTVLSPASLSSFPCRRQGLAFHITTRAHKTQQAREERAQKSRCCVPHRSFPFA